jgi:hypothetical protein
MKLGIYQMHNICCFNSSHFESKDHPGSFRQIPRLLSNNPKNSSSRPKSRSFITQQITYLNHDVISTARSILAQQITQPRRHLDRAQLLAQQITQPPRHLDRRRAASSRDGVERSLYFAFVLAVACLPDSRRPIPHAEEGGRIVSWRRINRDVKPDSAETPQNKGDINADRILSLHYNRNSKEKARSLLWAFLFDPKREVRT